MIELIKAWNRRGAEFFASLLGVDLHPLAVLDPEDVGE